MVSCILTLPLLAAKRKFRATALVSAIVLAECAVLAANHFVCPITNLAAHYTADRAPNFDIYLPLWLAQRNKAVFGTMFAVVEVFCVWMWFSSRRRVDRGVPGRIEQTQRAHTPEG